MWSAVEKQNHQSETLKLFFFFKDKENVFVTVLTLVHFINLSSQKLLLKNNMFQDPHKSLFTKEVPGCVTHKAHIWAVENNFSPAFKFFSNRLDDNGWYSPERTGRKKENKQTKIPHNRKPRSRSFALWVDFGGDTNPDSL